jgi:hypothetical protein
LKPDTPLAEVARHLPTKAADHLLKEDAFVQEMVCTLIRDAVVFWEEQGVVLDPMAYQAVLNSLVAQSVGVVRNLERLVRENELLRSRLDGTP